jgi:hypothetical protein
LQYLYQQGNQNRNKWFEKVTTFAIIVSCFLLPLETPVSTPHSDTLLTSLHIGLALFFTVELLIRSIAHSLLTSTLTPYLSSPLNQVDFYICIVTTIDLICVVFGLDPAWFRLLRQSKSLMPLRLVRVNDNLNVVFHAFCNTVRGI